MTDPKQIKYAIGFDIGGTKIEAAVISSQGKVLRQSRFATPATYEKNRQCVLKMIDELQGDEELVGIGFGTPGSVDPKTGLLRNAPNSPAINGTSFFQDLQKDLTIPCRVENDANCLVLSEYFFGAGRGYKNVVGIILGTGVGSGVILEGRLFTGMHGLAPELGHIILDVNGRRCLCGNVGCVEAYLSGPSHLRRYHDAGGDSSVDSTEEIFLRKDDSVAQSLLKESRYLFSRFIASLVSVYDPEVVVLGGGLSEQSLFYECEDEISRYVFGSNKAPKVLRAENGDASGKLGAASLFF